MSGSYERALELDEQSWRALAALAALAAESGDPTAALALYDRALAAGPSDPAPAFAAVALVREPEPDEAVRRLVKLLDQHPREAAAAIELAGIFADRGEFRRARNYAGRATWFKSPDAKETLERIEKLRAAAAEASDPGSPEESAEPDELVEPAE